MRYRRLNSIFRAYVNHSYTRKLACDVGIEHNARAYKNCSDSYYNICISELSIQERTGMLKVMEFVIDENFRIAYNAKVYYLNG